jgi:hypothetical protein
MFPLRRLPEVTLHETIGTYRPLPRCRWFGLAWLLTIAATVSIGGLAMTARIRPTLGKTSATFQEASPPSGTSTAKRSEAESIADLGGVPELTPRVIVEQTAFDFGQMNPHTNGKHIFVVKNSGTGPLCLLDHRSTCKCTVGNFTHDAIAPGGQAEITIQWQTQSNNQRFKESAIVETNDPETPSLKFTITGDVLVQVGANPPEFAFSGVRPGTRPTATTLVSSQVWPGVSLRNIRSSLNGLEWTIMPASTEECDQLKVLAAQRLTIQLPDSLPPGHFTHWVRFEVVPDVLGVTPEEYELPVRGKVLRRLAAYGPGIDNLGNVRLGVVASAEGLKRRLLLKVHDRDPALKVQRIDIEPDFLHASVTQDQSHATKGLYFLDIEVPKMAPACICQDQRAGVLTVRFGHPRISELKLRVHFAVAGQPADSH